MHIAIDTLAAHARKTGIGTYISSLVAGLAKVDRENDYTLLVSHENAAIFPDGRPRFQKVYGPRFIDNTMLRVLWEHTLLPVEVWRRRAHLLHAPTFVSPLLSRLPSVITIPDMTWFTHASEHIPMKRRYYQSLMPLSAQRARKIISISDSTRQDILRILKVPEDKVVTIYLGVDDIFRPVRAPERMAAIKQKYGLPEKFVLFVGMLEPRKNLVRVIEAYGRIKGQLGDCRLVLAGNKGWGYADAVRAAGRLGLEKEVLFPGPIPDEELPALFSAAALFVYPSLYEGFGLPPLEAMSCGTPVVTSNVSSLPEVAGDAALLVDPLDVEGLAAAMLELLHDAALRDKLIQRGLARASLFTWEEAARRTLAVYQDVFSSLGRQAT